MPENPKPRQKPTATQPPQAKFCHIYDKVDSWRVYGIRENVCVPESEHPLTEFEGKHYCLFHLPKKEKDTAKFKEIFQARLERTDRQCADIEAEFPDDESKQKEAKKERNIDYDFRYVWFPSEVRLSNQKFSASADFSSATFSASADFRSATFSASAYFRSATFSASAYFRSATFSASAYFTEATFSASAYFSEATFSAEADFSSATFSASAYFRSATFRASADFILATFDEKSQIFFIQTKFLATLNFNYAVFKGYVAFEGKKENRLFTAEESMLDMQNARIGDAKKISFHTVRLEPSWFVNTDASEFIFTDCEWYYVGGKPLKVKKELQNLRDRKDYDDEPMFENPNALLTKACWQLADNHEESKSFAKSSLFRQLAHESRRFETPRYFQPFTLHWWYYAFSFYGERWTRAFVMLVLILFLCGAFYNSPFAYFESSEKKNTIKTEDPKPKEYYKMNNFEGLIHSLNIAALQRPEPKPATDCELTKAVVILETIFAPLQAALLALAIRRKFMR